MLATVSDSVLAVPQINNRTSFAGVAVPLTIDVRQRLKSSGVKVVETPLLGVAQLNVQLTNIQGSTGVLGVTNENLVARDVIWRMVIEIDLIGEDGRKLLGPEYVTVDARNLTAGGLTAEQFNGEKTRSRLISKAADLIVAAVLESL